MRSATAVRLGMALLGAVHAWWGVWAWLFPRHFFDTFPGFGRRWTAAYPPYNEHLVTDLGATFLTLAFVLLAGCWPRAGQADRTVRTVALVATALFSALHLGFHARDPGHMGGTDLGLSLVFLVVGVLAPAGLLVWDRLTGEGRRSRPPAGP